MKLNLHKLKYNIWLYFILFALGLMCIIWFIQLVFTERYFLEDIEASLRTKAEELEDRYLGISDDPETVASFTSYATSIETENIYVVITTKSYNGGKDIPDACFPNNTYKMEKYFDEYGNIINQAKNNADQYGPTEAFCNELESQENQTGKYYVYAKRISEGGEGEDPTYLILMSSLSYISDVLSLIQKQLGIISVVVIVITFFVSLLIASNLSNPLVNTTKTVKRLARGDFSAEFVANGYSEIKELSDSLNYMKEELKKTSVLQRELLANVTHDLKTPLTMVKAYAEMIKDISGDNKEKRDKHAQVIIDEADRLTMLVNDILNLSKVQSNVDELDIERVNLSLLTNKVIDHFSSFSEKNGYVINASVEEGIQVECDSKKIEQVLYNLIGNAINYTGENKTVEVFLSVNEKKAVFEVVDSGKGIDEDKIDTIWEKYYRASDTHKRPVKGTGLGLSIVKAILEAHNLRYGVVSKKNVGSNFFVEFPLFVEEVKDERPVKS